MSTTPPPIGSMYLYDDVTPPLVDGSYRLDVVTNVTYGGQQAPLTKNSGYFNIEGPRFSSAGHRRCGRLPAQQRSRRLRREHSPDRHRPAHPALGAPPHLRSKSHRHTHPRPVDTAAQPVSPRPRHAPGIRAGALARAAVISGGRIHPPSERAFEIGRARRRVCPPRGPRRHHLRLR